MSSSKGSTRDFSALEQRRMKAARMFSRGKSQAEVARVLGVSRQSASVWYARWQEDGSKGLKAAGRAGRKPRITPEQKARVERQLARGPRAFGYATDLWTLPRIREVIKKVTGVDYHPGHVWKILKSMGWSCQKPVGKAAERDEAQIARWLKEDWPEVKKTPRKRALRSSS